MTEAPDTVAPRHKASLRLRLTIWMASVAAVVYCSLLVIILLYNRRVVDHFFVERIGARTERLESSLRAAGFPLTDEALDRVNSLPFMGESSALAIYAAEGRLLASSRRPARLGDTLARLPGKDSLSPVDAYRVRLSGSPLDHDPGHRVGLRSLHAPDGSRLVLAVVSTDGYFEELIALSSRVLLFTAPAGVLAAFVAGWVIAGKAVAPLRHLRKVTASMWPEAPAGPAADPTPAALTKELAALESDLHEARDRLARALHAQDRFIASVSHELKTPIAVLLIEAQTLTHAELNPAALAFARSVAEEMRFLGRMVESLLLLTRFRGGGAGAAGLRASPVNDLIMDAVVTSREAAVKRGVTVVPLLAPDQPALEIVGEIDLLRIMVENLIRNGVRCSPAGSQILVSAAARNGSCDIRVRDSGPPVPPASVAALFDRYAQPQQPAPALRNRGYDVGLSIALGIAEAHGGTLSVLTPPNGGCEFVAALHREPGERPMESLA